MTTLLKNNKVLTPQVEKKLKEIIQHIAIEKGFEVAMVEVGEYNSLNWGEGSESRLRAYICVSSL